MRAYETLTTMAQQTAEEIAAGEPLLGKLMIFEVLRILAPGRTRAIPNDRLVNLLVGILPASYGGGSYDCVRKTLSRLERLTRETAAFAGNGAKETPEALEMLSVKNLLHGVPRSEKVYSGQKRKTVWWFEQKDSAQVTLLLQMINASDLDPQTRSALTATVRSIHPAMEREMADRILNSKRPDAIQKLLAWEGCGMRMPVKTGTLMNAMAAKTKVRLSWHDQMGAHDQDLIPKRLLFQEGGLRVLEYGADREPLTVSLCDITRASA